MQSPQSDLTPWSLTLFLGQIVYFMIEHPSIINKVTIIFQKEKLYKEMLIITEVLRDDFQGNALHRLNKQKIMQTKEKERQVASLSNKGNSFRSDTISQWDITVHKRS